MQYNEYSCFVLVEWEEDGFPEASDHEMDNQDREECIRLCYVERMLMLSEDEGKEPQRFNRCSVEEVAGHPSYLEIKHNW